MISLPFFIEYRMEITCGVTANVWKTLLFNVAAGDSGLCDNGSLLRYPSLDLCFFSGSFDAEVPCRSDSPRELDSPSRPLYFQQTLFFPLILDLLIIVAYSYDFVGLFIRKETENIQTHTKNKAKEFCVWTLVNVLTQTLVKTIPCRNKE